MKWLENWLKRQETGAPGPKQSTGVLFDLTLDGDSDIGFQSRKLRWQRDGPIRVVIEDLSGNSNAQVAYIGSPTKKFKLTISRLSEASSAQQI